MKKNLKILFIVKERSVYGTKSICYGLLNSCEFVSNELNNHGIESKVIQVKDNNDIDREVFKYKPTHCFIEALWVVPSKFKELAKLHPTVKWFVRLHSMIPFLVSEGNAFEWINEYQQLKESGININVSCNNRRLTKELNSIYKDIIYTPNIYKPKIDENKSVPSFDINKHSHIINVGCFGALRILKNHVQQAIWTIQFANKINKTLHFHISVSEHETNETTPVLKNLRSIFKNTKHKLIEHNWMPHDDFVELIKHMDFGLQLSFTETYCIVAADFVLAEIPIIVSEEIDFISKETTVDILNEQSVKAGFDVLTPTWRGKDLNMIKHNLNLLNEKNAEAVRIWIKFLEK